MGLFRRSLSLQLEVNCSLQKMFYTYIHQGSAQDFLSGGHRCAQCSVLLRNKII